MLSVWTLSELTCLFVYVSFFIDLSLTVCQSVCLSVSLSYETFERSMPVTTEMLSMAGIAASGVANLVLTLVDAELPVIVALTARLAAATKGCL